MLASAITSRLLHGVPRTSMTKWLKDDAEVMRKRESADSKAYRIGNGAG